MRIIASVIHFIPHHTHNDNEITDISINKKSTETDVILTFKLMQCNSENGSTEMLDPLHRRLG